MFVVLLHYLQPLADIEAFLQEHREYLERQYAAGHFVASGPQVPRVGGVILVRNLGRDALDVVLAQDPFYREGIAQYQIIEFAPNKFAAGAQWVLCGDH